MSFSFLPPVLFNKTPLTSFLLFSFLTIKEFLRVKDIKSDMRAIETCSYIFIFIRIPIYVCGLVGLLGVKG